MDIWDYIFGKCVSGSGIDFDFEVEAGARRGYAVLPASLLRVIQWKSTTGLCYADRRLSNQRNWAQGLHSTTICMDHLVYVRDGKDLEFFLERFRKHFGQGCGFTLLGLEELCSYDTDASYRQIRTVKDWSRIHRRHRDYVAAIAPVTSGRRKKKSKAAVSATLL